jgi:hypothetical protein
VEPGNAASGGLVGEKPLPRGRKPRELFVDSIGRGIDVSMLRDKLREQKPGMMSVEELWRANCTLAPWGIRDGTLTRAVSDCQLGGYLNRPKVELAKAAARGRAWNEHLAKIALMARYPRTKTRPIIVDLEGRLIDGCHRLASRRLQGAESALVLSVNLS